MNKMNFSSSFSKEGRLARTILIIQFVLSIIAFSSFMFRSIPSFWIAAVFAGFALFSVGLLLAYLYLIYRNQPEFKEKEQIGRKKNQLEKKLSKAKASVVTVDKKRIQIEKDESKALALREKTHTEAVANYNLQKSDLQDDENRELERTLSALHQRLFSEQLRAAPLADAKISGVGDGLKKRLASHGIVFASDVTATRVTAVPGFGDKTTTTVVNWRNQVEDEIWRNLPSSLPTETESSIRNKYNDLLDEIEENEANEFNEYAEDKADIHEQARQRHERNEIRQARAFEQEKQYTPLVDDIAATWDAYSTISFRYFIERAISGNGGASRKRSVAYYLAFGVLAISGIVCQAGTGIASLGGITIASIPTNTSTPTVTATVTGTFTQTLTSTSTITTTPTITRTPTITDTPTITATFTLSPTSTPTRTLVPTATSPPPPTLAIVPPPQPQSNCHPSYPTVCIPPPPPDLDCGDIPYKRFQVIGSDPHRFDGDNDGIGCES